MFKLLTLFTLMLALSFSSCQNKQQTTEKEGTEKSCCSSQSEAKIEKKAFTPEKLMAEGASLVGQQIKIQGTVSHVCKHGGKKCFLTSEDSEAGVQVMAGGDIAAFDKELIGSDIVVKGTVKERRVTKDQIAEQENALKEAVKKADSKEKSEHCSHSMQNVDKMKQWITDNSKDYYPVYFVEGISYEVVK